MHLFKVELDPFKTLTVHFVCLFQGLYLTLAFAVSMCPFSVLKQHRTLANFLLLHFWPLFRSQMHLLGVERDPFRTLKVHFDCLFQGLYPTPAFAVRVCPFLMLKQHRTLANFLVLRFWPLFVPKCTFPGSNLTHLKP